GAFKGAFSNETLNDSPNNTGLQRMPPLQYPLVWYSNATSDLFPVMGHGGRAACVNVGYNQEQRPASFPPWFDNVLVVHEWRRGFIRLVKLTATNKVETIQPFLSDLKLKHPSDMMQDHDGNLYVLDYGSNWLGNHDGRLLKIRFMGWDSHIAPNLPATDDP